MSIVNLRFVVPTTYENWIDDCVLVAGDLRNADNLEAAQTMCDLADFLIDNRSLHTSLLSQNPILNTKEI